MVIRPFTEIDRDQVIQLWHDCGLVVPWNDPHRDIDRKLTVNPEWFLVCEERGVVIGSCVVGFEGHRGWINYLAVSPRHQREGIATKLMDEAERILRCAGCPKINLQVRSSNEKVIQFYRSLDYKVDEVLSMSKRLETDE